MKHLKIYENKISAMMMFRQIKEFNYEFVDNALKNGDVDMTETVGSIKYPILFAVKDVGMLEIFIEHKVDLFITNKNNETFIDYLEIHSNLENNIKILKYIKWKYPKLYQDNILRKESDKYNL